MTTLSFLSKKSKTKLDRPSTPCYNTRMKKENIRCDACGLSFSEDQLAHNWLNSTLCIECDKEIAKDMDEFFGIPEDEDCLYDEG